MYDSSGKLSNIFKKRYENVALAILRMEDRKKQVARIKAGLAPTDDILPFNRDKATYEETAAILEPLGIDWRKLTDPEVPIKEWRQKVNLGLLKHSCEFNYKSILKDFLTVRWHMTKLNTPVMDRQQVLRLISKTRMYRVINRGFLNLNKDGKIWLVGQKTLLEKYNINDNRFVFLELEQLNNLPNTILEVFAFENQRRYSNDLYAFRAECVAAQKTKQRGTSIKLAAKMTSMSVSTIQRIKIKSNWIDNGYTVDNQNGTFKSTDGNLLRRCEQIFIGSYDVIYEIKTGSGYQRSYGHFYDAMKARKKDHIITDEVFENIINSYLAA